jgi:Flp pilus assembly protein TadG
MNTTKRSCLGVTKRSKPSHISSLPEAPSRRRAQAGSSLVEMAFMLPVLLTIVMGVFTFGIALNKYLILTNSTTVGAQALAFARGQTTDPCATAVTAFEAAAPYLNTSQLGFKFAFNGGTLTTESSCTSQTLVSGQAAQMQVTYPCNLQVYGYNFAPSCTLTAQTTEAIE